MDQTDRHVNPISMFRLHARLLSIAVLLISVVIFAFISRVRAGSFIAIDDQPLGYSIYVKSVSLPRDGFVVFRMVSRYPPDIVAQSGFLTAGQHSNLTYGFNRNSWEASSGLGNKIEAILYEDTDSNKRFDPTVDIPMIHAGKQMYKKQFRILPEVVVQPAVCDAGLEQDFSGTAPLSDWLMSRGVTVSDGKLRFSLSEWAHEFVMISRPFEGDFEVTAEGIQFKPQFESHQDYNAEFWFSLSGKKEIYDYVNWIKDGEGSRIVYKTSSDTVGTVDIPSDAVITISFRRRNDSVVTIIRSGDEQLVSSTLQNPIPDDTYVGMFSFIAGSANIQDVTTSVERVFVKCPE